MMLRLRSVHALVAVLALVTLACADPSASGPTAEVGAGDDAGESDSSDGGTPSVGSVTIAVGGQSAVVYIPTTLAQELGYYEDAGVEVTLENFEGGSQALQAMIGGSVDVTSGFYDHTIQMAAEDRELSSFVSLLDYPGLMLVVAPGMEDEITDVTDLAGRQVGVSAPGSSTDLFLKFLLAQAGMDTDAASVSGIGTGGSAVAAMEQGQVDAAVMIDPGYAQLVERNPDAVTLRDTRTPEGVEDVFGVSSYPAAVLYAQRSWIEENPEIASALAEAIVRTLEWMDEHTSEEIAEAMPAEFAGDDPAIYIQAIENSRQMFSTTGEMAEDGPPAVYEVLSLSIPAVAETDIDLGATYTNDYLP